MIESEPSNWVREIVHIGDDSYDVETEILQLFDAMHDPRSFNGHNNTGLIVGQSGPKNGCYGIKRPDLAERNRSNKGKPNLAARNPRPSVAGENNAMSRPEVKEKHQQSVLDAMSRPDVKERHRDATRIAQNKPEVKDSTSKRMKEYCAQPEVKAAKSKRVSGDNNPSRTHIMTCVGCGKTMSKAMFNRWNHGDTCQK